MACKRKGLFEAYINFVKIGYECSEDTKKGCCCDLTHKQISYLQVIDEHGDITFSDLAKCEDISKPTVTEMVNRLIDRGCVYKERSSKDRRVSYIRLTDKGRQIAHAEETAQMRLVERIEQCLTDDEITELIILLNKLY